MVPFLPPPSPATHSLGSDPTFPALLNHTASWRRRNRASSSHSAAWSVVVVGSTLPPRTHVFFTFAKPLSLSQSCDEPLRAGAYAIKKLVFFSTRLRSLLKSF